MTSKEGTIASIGRRTATIIITFTSVCWISTGVLAQQAADGTSAPATSWSLQAPVPDNAPHLVIAMAEPGESSLSGSDRAAEENGSAKGAPGVPLRTGLSRLNAGGLGTTNFRAEFTVRGQDIQTSSLGAGSKVYSLLSDESGSGSFRYEHRKNSFRSDQQSANGVSSSHEVEPSPRPLFQVAVGNWHLPIFLSAAASQ